MENAPLPSITTGNYKASGTRSMFARKIDRRCRIRDEIECQRRLSIARRQILDSEDSSRQRGPLKWPKESMILRSFSLHRATRPNANCRCTRDLIGYGGWSKYTRGQLPSQSE